MQQQAVIFDLDGTLLDTLEDLADSGNSVLARYGFAVHPTDAYRYFVGDGIDALVRRILPQRTHDQSTIDEFTEAYREEYGRRWDRKTRPYDGIEELLGVLTVQKIRIAVLSNKPDGVTKKCVGELLGGWAFDVVMGHHEGIARKPDPAAALQIAERWGLPPSRIVYVGDTATDMQTAVAAGMYPVGVLWGFRTEEELRANGAKVLIRQPAELLGVLKKPV